MYPKQCSSGPKQPQTNKEHRGKYSTKVVAFNRNHNNFPHFYYFTFLILDRAGFMSYSNSTDSALNSENNTFILKMTITCSILLSVCKSCTNRGTIPVLITSSIGGFGSDRQNKIIRPQSLYKRLFKDNITLNDSKIFKNLTVLMLDETFNY